MSQTISIKSYKYPHIPHVEYSGELVKETEEYWLVYCPPNSVLKHYINHTEYIHAEPSLHFFSKYHGYTVSISVDSAMRPTSMFCNISTPCKFQDQAITYIDIDMDYVKTKDGLWFLKNHEKYLENSERYHYPIQLTNFAVVSLQELKENIADGTFPFGVRDFSTFYEPIEK